MTNASQSTWSGKTALITGASSGIGASFARQLAADGCHLVLVARGENKLQALASELTKKHGIRAEVIRADLSVPRAGSQVFAETRKRSLDIDLLVNNAGFATNGPFETLPMARQLEEIQLNVSALVELSHAYLPQLIERRGAIINVASTAGFQPVPQMAVYGATKAFVLSFSEALWAEYESRGVRVLALCPGATDTPFFEIAGEAAALGAKANPDDVVRLGLEAVRKGRSHVVHGLANYFTANISRFVSRALTLRITRSIMMKNQQRLALPAAR